MPDSRTSKTVLATLHNRLGFANTQGQQQKERAMRTYFVHFCFNKKAAGGRKKNHIWKVRDSPFTDCSSHFAFTPKEWSNKLLGWCWQRSPEWTHRKMMNPTPPVLLPPNLATVVCQKAYTSAKHCLVFLTGLVGAEPLAPLPEGSLSPWRPFSFIGGMW